jgi:hypothetical protein
MNISAINHHRNILKSTSSLTNTGSVSDQKNKALKAQDFLNYLNQYGITGSCVKPSNPDDLAHQTINFNGIQNLRK